MGAYLILSVRGRGRGWGGGGRLFEAVYLSAVPRSQCQTAHNLIKLPRGHLLLLSFYAYVTGSTLSVLSSVS